MVIYFPFLPVDFLCNLTNSSKISLFLLFSKEISPNFFTNILFFLFNSCLSLRNFEYRLITDLGYGFDLTKNDVGSSIEPDQDYLFSPLRGIYSLDKGEIESSFKGQHLLDFMSGKFSNNMTKKVIKSIFRESLEAILGKELNARKYFN